MPQHTQPDSVDILAELGASWGWMLFFGIVTLIAGLATLVWPGRTVVVIAILFGIQLFFGGVFRVVAAFADSGEHHRVAQSLVGVLSIVVGVLVFRHVFQTIEILVLLLGVFWVVAGVMDLFGGLASRGLPHRGLVVLSGALGFIAGLIVLTYPGISVLALAWVLGVWLTIYGIILIAGSFQVKKAQTGPAMAA